MCEPAFSIGWGLPAFHQPVWYFDSRRGDPRSWGEQSGCTTCRSSKNTSLPTYHSLIVRLHRQEEASLRAWRLFLLLRVEHPFLFGQVAFLSRWSSYSVPLLSVLVASSDLFLKVELVIPAPTKGIQQLGASPLLASIYALRSSYWAA